jgi:GTP-binding protein Era
MVVDDTPDDPAPVRGGSAAAGDRGEPVLPGGSTARVPSTGRSGETGDAAETGGTGDRGDTSQAGEVGEQLGEQPGEALDQVHDRDRADAKDAEDEHVVEAAGERAYDEDDGDGIGWTADELDDEDDEVAWPEDEPGFRSGFVTLVGRPNVGKSTLLNQILGQKVAIVSDKPQTTRHRIQGVLNRPGVQVVFVDTPGLHKPRTALGERLNEAAQSTIGDVDVVVLVLDATQPFGRGDAWVSARVPDDAVVVVNKVDVADRGQVLAQLARAGELDLSAYFPVSARTGKGVAALVDHLIERLPEGPRYFPQGMVTDVPEAFRVAELVREQLLAVAREELPHSIATRVTEWEWPYIRCEILVERPSQKGIVVGRGGQVLKQVGIAVREQLPPGAYLELRVKVDRNWQRRPAALDRLGF